MKCSYVTTKINCAFANTFRAAESQTAQALQMPMLYKQQRISTADGIIQNPAFHYTSPQTVDQPRITKLDGNTEVADKSAITRIGDVQLSSSTDNLLKS